MTPGEAIMTLMWYFILLLIGFIADKYRERNKKHDLKIEEDTELIAQAKK